MNVYSRIIICFLLFISQKNQSQTKDTLVNVGTHKLHFNILKGNGIPILFESGGGNDATVWNSILPSIHKITSATIIMYDSAGHGKSTIDSLETDRFKHEIINPVKDLETGLKKLGYNKEIILVGHFYGGYLTTLYSTRNLSLVKSLILVDVNHNFMDKYIEEDIKEKETYLPELKKNFLGLYFHLLNERETTKLMSKLSIPNTIPVVDFVSDILPFKKIDKV